VRIRLHLSYANVVATLALFVALGGSSYAAVQLAASSVGSREVRDRSLRPRDLARRSVTRAKLGDGAVGRRELRRNAVTSRAVADRSLRAADLAAGQLPRGERGPQGPPGSDAQFAGAAAGGDLTGAYPSPQLAAGAIDSPSLFGAGAVPAAVVRHTSSVAAGAGVHNIEWTEIADRGGLFDPAAPAVLTAPLDGLYAVTASILLQNVDPGAIADVRLGTEGSAFASSDGPVSPLGSVALSTAALVPLSAGQEVRASVFLPDPGTISGNPGSFTMHRVSP
jgi:hypothetical protein